MVTTPSAARPGQDFFMVARVFRGVIDFAGAARVILAAVALIEMGLRAFVLPALALATTILRGIDFGRHEVLMAFEQADIPLALAARHGQRVRREAGVVDMTCRQ